MLGYPIAGPGKYTEGKSPGNVFFENNELLRNLWQDIKFEKKNYRDFLARLQKFFQRFPQQDSLLMKAAAVQYWVNQHYNYSVDPHTNVTANITMTEVTGHSSITFAMPAPDKGYLPDVVLQRGGTADCLDYALAKFIGLRALGVPPEDILYTVGLYTTDPKQLQSATRSGTPMNHAWTMVRDHASGQWLVLDDMSKNLPVLLETNTGILKDAVMENGVRKTVYQIPVVAMDGNGTIVYLDSMDSGRNFKIAPLAVFIAPQINIKGAAPENVSAPVRTPPKDFSPQSQPHL